MKSVVTQTSIHDDPESWPHLRISKRSNGCITNLVVLTDLYTERLDKFRGTVVGFSPNGKQAVTLRLGLQTTFEKKDFERFHGKVELESE
jgi:hypothetical protein